LENLRTSLLLRLFLLGLFCFSQIPLLKDLFLVSSFLIFYIKMGAYKDNLTIGKKA